MIKLLRLDERLIHGQVATKWSKHIGIDRIVIANDEASTSEVIQKTLVMAAPSNTKVLIKNIEDSIQILNDPRMVHVNALVLVNNPNDLLKIAQHVQNIPEINIGNYGRMAPKNSGAARKTYRPNLYLYEEEVNTLSETLELNIPTIYQTIPDDTPEQLSKIIK